MYHDEPAVQAEVGVQPQSINDVLPQESMLYCIADASWKSVDEMAGIGWSLYSRQGTLMMQGSSAIAPTNSALEAEAMATLLAVQQLHRLHFKDVIILGDNAQLFKSLEDQRGKVQDILNIAKQNAFSFKHVPRKLVHQVDQLAKRARMLNQQYVITWFSV
ncbi:hypothetical protein Bca4012_067381 [Brassica carinata]